MVLIQAKFKIKKEKSIERNYGKINRLINIILKISNIYAFI